jgi:hypothetical protein
MLSSVTGAAVFFLGNGIMGRSASDRLAET